MRKFKPLSFRNFKPIFETLDQDRWEVGFAISDQGLTNVSFVNSINTIKGGRHVDVVLEQIVKKLEEKVNAKNKGKRA